MWPSVYPIALLHVAPYIATWRLGSTSHRVATWRLATVWPSVYPIALLHLAPYIHMAVGVDQPPCGLMVLGVGQPPRGPLSVLMHLCMWRTARVSTPRDECVHGRGCVNVVVDVVDVFVRLMCVCCCFRRCCVCALILLVRCVPAGLFGRMCPDVYVCVVVFLCGFRVVFFLRMRPTC